MVPSLHRGAAHGLFASGPANYLVSILSLSTAATTANLVTYGFVCHSSDWAGAGEHIPEPSF